MDGSGITITIGTNGYNTTVTMPNDYGPLNGNSYVASTLAVSTQTDAGGHPLLSTLTYTDSNGNPQQFRIDFGAVAYQTSFCAILTASPCTEASGTYYLPQKLTLPSGKYYAFTWSSDGNVDLMRIDLPTGGYLAYSYQTFTRFTGITYSGGTGGKGKGTGSPTRHYRGRRQVTSRTVSDGTATNTWTYTGGTVRDPLGNETVHGFTNLSGRANDAKYETQILFYQGTAASGTLIRTINKDYAFLNSTVQPDAADHGAIDVRVIRETTILENGLQNKTETDYETFQQQFASPTYTFTVTRLNPTEKREYDYGSGVPGPLLRRTDYTYLHTGNQNYLSRNIVRQVLAETVYDGSSNQAAKTVNEYDV